MNGLPPPWSLPLIVVALLVPPLAGLVLLGPQGMILGAFLVGLALILIVARPRRERPIEVAEAGDERHHILIAANEAIESPRVAERIARNVRRPGSGAENGSDVLVVSPALNPRLDHWAADVADARARAKARLEASLERLSWAGVEARGWVGDSNPMLAIEDALRDFPADEVMVIASESTDRDLMHELRTRLDRPIEVLSPAGGETQG